MKPWTALAGMVLLAGCGSAAAQLETTSPSQAVVESTTVAPTTTTVPPPTTFAPVATTEAPKPRRVAAARPQLEPQAEPEALQVGEPCGENSVVAMDGSCTVVVPPGTPCGTNGIVAFDGRCIEH